MSEPSCVAVILAAGASRRLGQAKQLVKIDGEPLLGRTVRLAAQASCQPIVVVLGFEADRIRRALDGFRVIVAVNENWRAGIGSSMRCGVETALQISLPPKDILLMVCDQVRLSADVLRQLLRLHAFGQVSDYCRALQRAARGSGSFFLHLFSRSAWREWRPGSAENPRTKRRACWCGRLP